MIRIVNLTPHPITIVRNGRVYVPPGVDLEGATTTHESIPDPHGAPTERIEMTRVTFPACAPRDLPHATESPRSDLGATILGATGDGQEANANAYSMSATGLVDGVAFSGVENLPDLSPYEKAFGVDTFRIVSIVTAIGAFSAGRPIVDLLVPMGQVRDAQGRVVGATGLAPASALLSPMAERLIAMGRPRRAVVRDAEPIAVTDSLS